MYDFIISLLQGVDLVEYDFLPALLISVLIVLCLGVFFRAFLTLFNLFFTGH